MQNSAKRLIVGTQCVVAIGATLLAASAGHAGGGSATLSPDFDVSTPQSPATLANFVNWETPQVHPLAITPDGLRLLAVNTADNRLEVFDIGSGTAVPVGSVQVGLDPVSVRARSNNEVWVVNLISDSISVIDLATMRVARTIFTKDEPCDVVFAGSPQRAFVSCSQVNTLQVFDLANLNAAPIDVAIDAEDPRALEVSADGSAVYAAVFESGNGTTVLGGGASGTTTIGFPPNIVSQAGTPYNGVNPPPNVGIGFVPAKNAANGTPPRVSLIVRKNDAGEWRDDNTGNWTNWVSGPQAAQSGRLPGWDLPDRDLAVINANSLSVTYATRLMNINMAMGVNPATGFVTIVGTEATNEIRFEPVLKGKFVRVKMATVDPNSLAKSVVDLNPHLTYATSSIPQVDRDRSVGDPRAIVWRSAGDRGYVTGMGSNNVIVINPAGARAGLTQTIEVGEGPTGLALDESRSRLYVLNRFAGSISVISTTSELELSRVSFYDPTPSQIKVGRKHLYDTHRNSGLGQISCASCHVDSRMDRLGWDLGDPTGDLQALTGLNLGFGIPGLAPPFANPAFAPFHPMKGPMTTQTLQDIIGHEPHHWRGDRLGLENFANAFLGLQGADSSMGVTEMQEFENFLATITFPPNPYRNLDNSLSTNLPLPGHFTTGRFGTAGLPLPNGNAFAGMTLYRDTNRRLDNNTFACATCHTLPTGMGPDTTWNGSQHVPFAVGPLGQKHLGLVSTDGVTNISIKVPQLRNMHEKSGFNTTQLSNTAGFGYLHDGSVDSIERFVSEPVFTVASNQEVANLTAFMLSFAGDDLPAGSPTSIGLPPGPPGKHTHAAVGQQITFNGTNNSDTTLLSRLTTFLAEANLGRVSLVVKGRVAGQMRGWYLSSANTMRSDRASEPLLAETSLRALAATGSELTYTVVPTITAARIGVDRDTDGYFDRDELDAGSNPADPNSIPPTCDSIDFNNDGSLFDPQDIDAFLSVYSEGPCIPANATCNDIDFNNDTSVFDPCDISSFLLMYSEGPCTNCGI
ncbi:MAG: hypothetical protein U0640_09030 [Phycisphaerales bacterium]